MDDKKIKLLVQELNEAVDRIPKDVLFWKKEVRRLEKKKDRKSKQICKEYRQHASYYLGKAMAYIYIIQVLGKGRMLLCPKSVKLYSKCFKTANGLAMNKTLDKLKIST